MHILDRIVITDASCFITLDKIDGMHLLHSLYKQVLTTPEIAAEFGKRLPNWVEVKAVLNRDLLYNFAETVDIGEASAMALASEIHADLLIIDDAGGRRFAKRLNLNIIGTIGVILTAKLNGIIPSIKPYVIKIQQTNFRISDRLISQIRRVGKSTIKCTASRLSVSCKYPTLNNEIRLTIKLATAAN